MPKRLPPITDGMKTCTRCKQRKPLSAFYRQLVNSTGYNPQCKVCRERYATHVRDGGVRHKRRLARIREHHRENPEIRMWYDAKKRAKKRGTPFSITKSDVVIPEFCPVFGVRLVAAPDGSHSGHDWSPSLDVINSRLGYVPGNVQVMSKLANLMKNKATPEQLFQFANWVLKEQVKAVYRRDFPSRWNGRTFGREAPIQAV